MKLGDLKPQIRNLIARFKKLVAPVVRHHIIIAVLIISGVLMYAVVSVNQILSAPTDQEYLAERSKESIQTRFDEETISRIEQLRDREQNPSLGLPGGRISPFVE
jgi:5,10-methenyltetrahydromethanopterin hydrogenase